MGTHIPTYLASRALRCVSVVLLALAVLAGLCAASAMNPVRAYAADSDSTTLAVLVEHGQDSSAQKIDGMKFDVFQVAGIGDGGDYELLSVYTRSKVDFNNIESAKENIRAATILSRLAVNQKPVSTVTTDKNGKASVGSVENGIYLFVQKDAQGTAKDYTTLDPFLVAAPQFNEDGTITYDVVAKPKPEPAKKTEPKKPGTSSPKTGDPISPWMMVGCAAIGLAAMATAIYAARRRKER